jgi:hypothetical protein
MEINLGFTVLQLSDTQALGLFWVLSVIAAFNIAYFLYLSDRKQQGQSVVSTARVKMTVLTGSLIMVGTYADTLAQKPFAIKDCILLALIAAHGWMAEEMVEKFIQKVKKQQPVET